MIKEVSVKAQVRAGRFILLSALFCFWPSLSQAAGFFTDLVDKVNIFEQADELPASVKVVESYLEWRTGPASGYPVFNVSEQGEWLTLSIRKTDWVKVHDNKGKEGWVSVDDLLLTQDSTGERVSIVEPRFDDFKTHRWEAGLMNGEFDQSAVNAGYLAYWWTGNIITEIWASQVLGDASEILIANFNVVHEPFPHWRFSPFFTVGAGKLFIQPKATLAAEENRDEDTIHAGIGLKYYISNRYFARMELKDHKIFTHRETNEEAIEWKIGFGVFF